MLFCKVVYCGLFLNVVLGVFCWFLAGWFFGVLMSRVFVVFVFCCLYLKDYQLYINLI